MERFNRIATLLLVLMVAAWTSAAYADPAAQDSQGTTPATASCAPMPDEDPGDDPFSNDPFFNNDSESNEARPDPGAQSGPPRSDPAPSGASDDESDAEEDDNDGGGDPGEERHASFRQASSADASDEEGPADDPGDDGGDGSAAACAAEAKSDGASTTRMPASETLAKVQKNGVLTFMVRVPGAGSVGAQAWLLHKSTSKAKSKKGRKGKKASAAAAGKRAEKATGKRIPLGKVTRTVTKRGIYTLKIQITAAGLRSLKKVEGAPTLIVRTTVHVRNRKAQTRERLLVLHLRPVLDDGSKTFAG